MEVKLAEQTFKSEVGSCPEGMIPILRNQRPNSRTRGDIRQGIDSSHGHFQHKLTVNASEADPANLHDATVAHEYAKYQFSSGSALYRGAKGYFNVWKPSVEASYEFSLTQLRLAAGSSVQKDLNTIDVGWRVYNSTYYDALPHLFISWTTINGESEGCYDLQCPGFVQISSKVVVGGSLSASLSQTNGPQYEMQVIVFWDRGTDAWWLHVNGEYVGYWPNSLFTSLKAGANSVEWGGEILNGGNGSTHTKTDMGSGEFAQLGWQRAAFIRSLMTVTSTPQQVFVDAPLVPSKVITTKANCYSEQIFHDSSSPGDWRTWMYYGGPGLTYDCPT
ncbi:hypothetical protein R1sor_026297 [Riccia sorocarpa]|uniref:Neprosin PEP catalytic domain-containing protein n=1 Tax=Riccia sorocarpa TaxID=122646 RepID=A0ABD3GD18_9MARC